jgi:hypothetical protein
MVVIGGLQTGLHARLGGEEDGLRPRWLPHLSDLRLIQVGDEGLFTPGIWDKLLLSLLNVRSVHRGWRLDDSARASFSRHQRRWKSLAAQASEGTSVSGALQKADVHLLRIVGVFAEAENPGKGGMVEASLVERAALYMDAVLDCWRALPEQERLSLTFKDERLDACVDRVVDWLEQRDERQASARQILRRGVGGIRTAEQLKLVLDRYEATYKGSVTARPVGPHGGRPSVLVTAPRRRPAQESEDGVEENPTKPSEEVLSGVSVLGSQTLETAPVGADFEFKNGAATEELGDPGGFVSRVLSGLSAEDETRQNLLTKPSDKTPDVCRVCGRPLNESEIQANFGVCFDCTLPFRGTS